MARRPRRSPSWKISPHTFLGRGSLVWRSETSSTARNRPSPRTSPTQRRRSGQVRSSSSIALPTSRTFRSEEHTSELQSRRDLVCRLLLEKKKKDILDQFTTCIKNRAYKYGR